MNSDERQNAIAKLHQLRGRRDRIGDDMQDILHRCESQDRDLTDDEQREYQGLDKQLSAVVAEIKGLQEKIEGAFTENYKSLTQRVAGTFTESGVAPFETRSHTGVNRNMEKSIYEKFLSDF